MKTKATVNFIARAQAVHGDAYDYSLVEYINCKTKVKIICNKHGPFLQTPNKHLSQKTKCPACSNRPIITTDLFVERARAVHGLRYDYNKVHYVSFSHKVEIVCPSHGSFLQRPENHIRHKQGCPKCKHDLASRRGVGCYSEANLSNAVRGYLYLVEMSSSTERYCKIGITKNDINKRLGNHGCKIKTLIIHEGGMLDLYRFEQQVLMKLSNLRYKYRPKNSHARRMGWTECFPIENKNLLLQTVHETITAPE